MGSYPHVNPGDIFKPSVQEENDIRDLLNAVGRDGVRSNRGGMQVENICINAYNPGSEAIPSGVCIVFPSGAMVEGCVPVEKISDLTETTWGIAMDDIPSNQFGSVLVMGAAVVSVSGGSGDYIAPTESAGVFSRTDSGSAKVLREITDGAIVLVGVTPPGSGSAPVPTSEYNGPFKVEFLSRTSGNDIVVSVHEGDVVGENMTKFHVSGGIITFPYSSIGAGYIYAAGSHNVDAVHGGYQDHYNVEFYGGNTLPSKYSVAGGSGSNAQMFSVILAQLSVNAQTAKVTQKQFEDIHFVNWGHVEYLDSSFGYSSDGKRIELKTGANMSKGGAYIIDDVSPYGPYISGYATGIVPSVAAMRRFVESKIYDLAVANALVCPEPVQPSTPSTAPSITANVTSVTSGNVILTASFSNDTTVKSYRMAYGDPRSNELVFPDAWMNYTGPVSFSSNGIFQVMAQKAHDGMPLFASYEVNNIDRNPPKKPRIVVNTTSATSQVKVSAFFNDAVTKEYKIGDESWTSYTGAVTLTSNAKVTFRGIDSAGNSSTEYYVVENIESSNS